MANIEFTVDQGPVKMAKVAGYYVCKWCPLGGEEGYRKLEGRLCTPQGFSKCKHLLADGTFQIARVIPKPPLR